MKRVGLILAGILMVLGVSAQVIEVDMSVMRARHAVDTLVQNDVYLESGGTVDYTDSTAVFTTIDVDSAVIAVLDYLPPHGSLAFADSAAVIPLTQNIWAKITNGAQDLYTVINADGLTSAGDTITIITPGDYVLWMSLSFEGGPSDVYHVAVYVNEVITPFEMHRKTSNNDTGNASLNAYLDDLDTGDDISIYIRNTGDNDDATLVSSQITVFMLHPR